MPEQIITFSMQREIDNPLKIIVLEATGHLVSECSVFSISVPIIIICFDSYAVTPTSASPTQAHRRLRCFCQILKVFEKRKRWVALENVCVDRF